MDLARPAAGGRIRLSATGHVKRLPIDDPLAGATDAEREYYLAHYQGVPLAELLRRLRAAEWNAAEYKRQADAASAALNRMPPRHKIEDLAARHQRITALLDVPRRRTIPVVELREALYGRASEAADPAA